MENINLDHKNFLEKGYCVVRNVLSADEIQKYKSLIKNSSKEVGADVVIGIHNYKEYWDIIANEKILKIVKKILNNENIKYLYLAATRHESNKFNYAWHRDNPCRVFGVGADWKEKEIFNIVRVGVYLSPYESVKSGLNVLPYSHKKSFTFSNLLRVFHHKTKNSKNFYIKKIRGILEKIIGINIKTNSGDCVFFIASLLHAGIPPSENCDTRNAIFLTYGTENIHSENFINYWTKHRPYDSDGQINVPNKNVEELEKFLKDKNIYLPVPKEKKNIDGISIPK